MISHDRRFLETLSDAPRSGSIAASPAGSSGASPTSRHGATSVLEEEERDRHKLDRRIVREEHWLRYGVSARRTRNQRRLRALHDLRRERKESRANRPVGNGDAHRAGAGASGKLVIEAEAIAKSYGDRAIVRDLSLRIERGDRLGIVGPNGAGKTTLINLLTGALAPDTGTVRLGANLEIATLDQTPREPRPGGDGRRALTGGARRHGHHRRRGTPRGRLHEGLPVPAGAGAHAAEGAVRRRARRG